MPGALGALAVALIRAAAESPAQPPTGAIPHTDVSPYGADSLLDREIEFWEQEKTLEMARAAGIR